VQLREVRAWTDRRRTASPSGWSRGPAGTHAALEKLFPLVTADLRRLARRAVPEGERTPLSAHLGNAPDS
jgi:hypothetical protein